LKRNKVNVIVDREDTALWRKFKKCEIIEERKMQALLFG
jgi:hypothetical protein